MKSFCAKAFVIAAASLMASADAAAQVDERRGELRIYDRATQINTVASRTFKDDKGRVVKTIYYTGGGGIEGPYREELLREQSIDVMAYDDEGCVVKRERYAPGMRLLHFTETVCREGTPTPRLSTMRGADGVRQSLTRHEEDGSTKTSLFFGDDGERIVAIDGDTPSDVDLAGGWGEKARGFRVGIGANRDRGPQNALLVWVTIKNGSNRDEGVPMVAVLSLELKNAGGALIPLKSEWAYGQTDSTPGECRGNTAQGAPGVGESDLLRSYNLGEYFDRLAPGRYSLTVTHCLSKTKEQIVSNTIHVEIE